MSAGSSSTPAVSTSRRQNVPVGSPVSNRGNLTQPPYGGSQAKCCGHAAKNASNAGRFSVMIARGW